MDTRCPVPRLWIRSAEVQGGGGGGGGGTSLGEWEHNNNLKIIICLRKSEFLLKEFMFVSLNIGHAITLMYLSIGTPENTKLSICSKWKAYDF